MMEWLDNVGVNAHVSVGKLIDRVCKACEGAHKDGWALRLELRW